MERHGLGNLILICPAHHKVIDAAPETYTVEELERIKAEHERAHAGGPEPGDAVVRQFLDSHRDRGRAIRRGRRLSGRRGPRRHQERLCYPAFAYSPPAPGTRDPLCWRQTEMARVLDALQPGEVVTLCGTGGSARARWDGCEPGGALIDDEGAGGQEARSFVPRTVLVRRDRTCTT